VVLENKHGNDPDMKQQTLKSIPEELALFSFIASANIFVYLQFETFRFSAATCNIAFTASY